MGKRELGKDKQGVQFRLYESQIWAYGLGVLGITAINQLIGQLSFFYTDKVGMAAGLAGTAIMVARIADAGTDLVMGVVVDRTNSKWGKARPWMLWMSPFVFIAVMGLLLIPSNASSQFQFGYAVVSNILASAIVCTAVSVPYACLLNYASRSQYERTKMNVRRTICNYILGMFFSVGLIPLTKMMGGTQKSWIIVGFVIAIIAMGGMLLCFRSVKEDDTSNKKSAQKIEKFFIQVRALFRNKYWIIMTLAMLVAHVIYGFNAATNAYYAKWIFGNESIVGIMGAIAALPTLLGFVVVSPLVKKFGNRNVIRAGLALGVAGYIVRALFPYNFVVVCISGAFTSIGIMPFMMTGMVMIANVSDFEEWKTGVKKVGLVQTATSFGGKVGGGFASGIIGWALAFGGYVSSAAVQTESAITSVFAICIYIPAILYAVLLILIQLFDMDKKYPGFREELEERNCANC